jgi:UDP-glucuronate decarboxylase
LAEAVVTGAAGFLGSHLVDSLLEDGWQVRGVDNLVTGRRVNLAGARTHPRFRFQKLDLTRSATLPRADQYYHLASPASPPAYQRDPIGTLRVNSVGTYHVLETARRYDARMLLASTSEVYGDPEVHPQTEEYWGHVNPIGARSCYDEGKRYAEALATAYRRIYGLDVRIARIFNTYGPRMDPADGRVVSNFIVQGLRGAPLTIYGQGKQTRSFCYVSDTVRGLRSMMRAGSRVPTPMNIGNPREFSIRTAAELVARALGIAVRLEFRPLPEDDPKRRSPDIHRAMRYLRWSPRFSFEQGLPPTVAYFRSLEPARSRAR